MGSDLASVLWDVLDGYNFYKNFKTTAIGNDRRGLPQPVNRSLFFDEADSDDEHAFTESDSSRQSQFKGNLTRWTQLINFLVALGHDLKDSVIVCTNSTWFFCRKAFNRKCHFVSLLILLIGILAVLLELAITSNTISVFRGKESAVLHDIEDTGWSASPPSESINLFPNNPKPVEPCPNGENLADISKCTEGFVASNPNDNVETCQQQIIEFSKKLQEIEIAWTEQSEAQLRSIEALKQQVSDLQKSFLGSEVLSEESSQTRNERFEEWKQSISGLVTETKNKITALKVDFEVRLTELASKTSGIDTIESKIAVLTEQLASVRSSLNKKMSALQNLVDGSSGYLTAGDVREIVRQETEKKAGEVNWITGVSAHSSTHKDSFFALPMLVTIERSPEMTVMKRNCWPMDGSEGFIQYELADKVLVQILTLEHLHKSRRVILGSVPREFRVEGSPDDGRTWLNLGSNTYDAEGPAVQHFNIEQTSEPLKTIKLFILSNYGEQYTCLYGVAVHGKRST